MDDETKNVIVAAWRTRVGAESINSPPADETALLAFETEFGKIPSDFRWFLAACGGGPVGSEWVDNLQNLFATHRKFKAETGPRGWTMADVFIIGWDGWGNPYGIHIPTGRV